MEMTLRRIRRTWRHALQRAGLRQPPTPHVHLNDQGIATIATPGGQVHGTWHFSQDELDIMGLQPGDQLGPGIVGPPRHEP